MKLTTDLGQQIATLTAERKGLDIKLIDVRGRCSYTDFLVVASGTSDRHVKSIAELVEGELRQQGVRCLGHEGLQEGQWALVDFGDAILHVFHEAVRSDYNLEQLWTGAPIRPVEAIAPEGHYPADSLHEELAPFAHV
jgi:ribosome-associated protein